MAVPTRASLKTKLYLALRRDDPILMEEWRKQGVLAEHVDIQVDIAMQTIYGLLGDPPYSGDFYGFDEPTSVEMAATDAAIEALLDYPDKGKYR